MRIGWVRIEGERSYRGPNPTGPPHESGRWPVGPSRSNAAARERLEPNAPPLDPEWTVHPTGTRRGSRPRKPESDDGERVLPQSRRDRRHPRRGARADRPSTWGRCGRPREWREGSSRRRGLPAGETKHPMDAVRTGIAPGDCPGHHPVNSRKDRHGRRNRRSAKVVRGCST